MALRVAYDGTGFSGFQRQSDRGARTVQGVLEEALGRLCGQAPASLGLRAAGRTDAGVHAQGQVVAFLTERQWSADRWLRALSGVLPPDVVVQDVAFPVPDFDPRRMAVARRYGYRWLVSLASDPMRRHVTWHVGPACDLVAVDRAWRGLVGYHDFSAFRSTGSNPRSPWVTVHRAWLDTAADEVILRIEATSFLYHMVRRLVGAVREVATGRKSVDSFLDLFSEGRDSFSPPVTAPARGLSLDAVVYPQELISWSSTLVSLQGPIDAGT